MEVEWDPKKAVENYKKHGVRLSEAAIALEDPRALTRSDDDHSEPRWVTLGADSTSTLLVVVWTEGRHAVVRIISARKASPGEQECYEGR